MRKGIVAICLLLAALLCFGGTPVLGQDDLQTQIEQIKKQLQEMDGLKARLAELEQKLNDSEKAQADIESTKAAVTEPEGAIQTTISDVAKLKKIKVSGYVQARFESYQNPTGLNNTGNNKSSDDRFYVRRGRFKISGQPTDNSVGVVQLDMGGYDRSKVETKDVYLEYHPWGVGVPAPFMVRFGQQTWPFGYALERSDSVAEVPERAKILSGTTVSLSGYPSFPGLFPGERDKGIALFNVDGAKVEWALGAFNGTGTKSGDAGSAFLESSGKFEDNNNNIAIVGRIRYPMSENVRFGISGYKGTQAVRTVSNAPAAVEVDQTRWGADFQYYMPNASIKAEYIEGKEPYYSNTTTTPNSTSGANRTVKGWYVLGVKNISVKDQLVAQYDVLNDAAMKSTFGRLSTWNFGVVHFLDNATKLKVFYEFNNEEKHPVRDNGLRVEMITNF